MVYVIHLAETDGDIHYERCFTFKEAAAYIKNHNLCEGDCTIIHGTIHDARHLKGLINKD